MKEKGDDSRIGKFRVLPDRLIIRIRFLNLFESESGVHSVP
jgi:hypothetical protein